VAPAPGLFSTTKGCPKTSRKWSASNRPATSVTVPAPTGTTNVIGRDGHFSCALTLGPLNDATAAITATMVKDKARRTPIMNAPTF
jgi:hypothetical protein